MFIDTVIQQQSPNDTVSQQSKQLHGLMNLIKHLMRVGTTMGVAMGMKTQWATMRNGVQRGNGMTVTHLRR